MQVKELHRENTPTGETVVEIEAEKLLVRLNGTFNGNRTLDELIYIIACNRLAEKRARQPA